MKLVLTTTPPHGVPAVVPQARAGRAPAARAVRRQVEQILSSGDFDASPRSRDFLRFIVEEVLAGRGEDVTQSVIATRVFGRRDDFDATVDPIVRIQAGRLRRSLERYYLLSGRHDAVRIELPRGGYVPAFHARAADAPADVAEPAAQMRAPLVRVDDWPSLVIRPFEPGPPGSPLRDEAARVSEELVLELGRYSDVRLLLHTELEKLAPSRRERVRFSLGGRLRELDGELRVSAQLLDRDSGEQLWGDEYHTAPRAGRWSGSLEDIARVVAARVGAEEGVLVQRLAAERRQSPPETNTPFGAMLLSYEFFLARDPQSLGPALEALRKVVKDDPENSAAWTRLARVSLANYAFEVTSIPTPIDDAVTCAHYGVRVDPASRRGRAILAATLLVKGELDAARAELDEALRLSPDSLVYLEIIGYLLTLVGDVERGPALIRQARARNPHCLPNAPMGLWYDHIRRGQVDEAYRVALEFRDPTFFWRAVMRASCLGLLGRGADAAGEVAELLKSYPSFEARGRGMIGYYVKFPEVMDPVVEGLARAGLRLA